MSQPYGGQQPPQGSNQNYQGYPQAPQAPAGGYGSMPQAPQEYTGGPIPRPGAVTAAAVLAFVQAGLTTITTLIVWIGVFNLEGGEMAMQALIALAQTAGVVLLIMGGLQMMSGKGRTLLIVGAALEVAISLFYMIIYSTLDAGGIDVLEGAKALLIGAAVFFAIMPVICIVLARGALATQYLQPHRR
ncbi:hypothetical protein BLA60_14780 [Actinophytocola xinjiangensis]|uniref:Uncharacterized protein n=1 Tax=Actinophytocola xinjiangensis TaxID=485602 RepID=A0A7Z0WLR5_9PSEU|nr:hypothetical protein [Actinophytocola xinjiangensis]OLF10466.1 hypothetical protein BLA60_14780 [Actinophytocola xinjiangensis]